MNRRKQNPRTRELAAIHAAARDLRMDDDSYRAMLWSVARVRSAADLDAGGRRQVLDHMRRIGWQGKPRRRVGEHPGRPHNMDRSQMLAKIEAQLADMGLPWSYADAIARRQAGVERVAWVRKPEHLRGIIAALHTEQEKRDRLAEIDRMLQELGLGRDYVQALMPRGYSKDWTRDLRMLKPVAKHLGQRLGAGKEQ